ncbi:MAG: DinB family protein [Planctomycetota bacterium]
MIDTSKIAGEIESLVNIWFERLGSLSEDVVRHRPAPDRWSVSEVIGHLVDSACNNHQRFVRAQSLQSLRFPKYDQNAWVLAANYQETDWATLLSLWHSYNRVIASLIQMIPSSAFETQCTIIPYEPCTLEFLIEDYLTHLKHHLEILEKRLQESARE